MPDLESRLIALERANRRWRLFAAVSACCLAACLLGGEALPDSGYIQGKSLWIVDDHGVGRFTVTVKDDTTRFCMADTQGLPRASLQVDPAESELSLDSNAKPTHCANLVASQKDPAQVQLIDMPQNKDASLSSEEMLIDTKSNAVIDIGTDSKTQLPFVTVSDNKDMRCNGEMGVEMKKDNSFTPYIRLTNSDGSKLMSVPPK